LGWKIVFARGFSVKPRIKPIHYIYFVDPSDVLRLKVDGDLFVWQVFADDLFWIGSEFVIVTMRGETGISHVIHVWLLPKDGVPKLVLQVGGYLDWIQTDAKRGLYVRVFDPARSDREDAWRREFWEWDEGSGSFRRR
jgi:hypothetical protein